MYPAALARPDVRSGRAGEHFNLFEVVDVPGEQTVVADTVDEEAVVGREAAHVEHVAAGVRGPATFARLHRDSWHVPQRLGERRRALLVEQRRRNDLDGLRRFDRRSGILHRFESRLAGDLNGVGGDANINRDRRRVDETVRQARSVEQPLERLLRRQRSADAGRGHGRDHVRSRADGETGDRFELLNRRCERAGLDREAKHRSVAALSLVGIRRGAVVCLDRHPLAAAELKRACRQRFTRGPDPDVRQRCFQLSDVDHDAALDGNRRRLRSV